MRGGSKFTDFFKKVGKWFKKTKILSKVANAVGHVIPVGKKVSSGLASLGLGRGRRRITRRRATSKKTYSFNGL
jgi:hypothetical protein